MHLRLSAMMFLQYFVWGAWFVPLGTYMAAARHFTAGDIGMAFGMQGVGAIIAPLAVGVIADRFMASQKVFGLLHLAAAVAMYLLAGAAGARPFLAMVLVYFVLYMPTLPIANAISFGALRNVEQEFPAIRVFGTIGWICSGLAIGLIPGAATSGLPMGISAIGSLVLGVYAFSLPDVPPRGRAQGSGVMALLGLDILAGMKSRSFWVLIAGSTLLVIPLSFYYAFTNPFLSALHARLPLFSLSLEPTGMMVFGQLSETLFIVLLPVLLRHGGIRRIMIAGMLAWVARYLCFAYGFTAAGPITGLLMIGILLHGVCYDFFFVAGQIHVDQAFDPSQRARAQSFLALMTLGVGQVAGSNLAGRIVEAASSGGVVDWRVVWLLPAALALVVALGFALLFRAEQGKAAG